MIPFEPYYLIDQAAVDYLERLAGRLALGLKLQDQGDAQKTLSEVILTAIKERGPVDIDTLSEATK
tara:strand:+ start:105 stop:302 length:198 start_codon:yes stop_codon:yes gene_type:complete